MAASLYRTATEFVANAITLSRGSADDIDRVGVFHSTDPSVVPTPEQFTEVPIVKPGDPLADGNNLDVLSLVGPRAGDLQLAPGDHQRWVLVETASESMIRRVDVLTVL